MTKRVGEGMAIDGVTNAFFDDFTENDTPDSTYPYWTQVCDDCARGYNFPAGALDEGSGSGY